MKSWADVFATHCVEKQGFEIVHPGHGVPGALTTHVGKHFAKTIVPSKTLSGKIAKSSAAKIGIQSPCDECSNCCTSAIFETLLPPGKGMLSHQRIAPSNIASPLPKLFSNLDRPPKYFFV